MVPILLNIPESFETERLLLRVPQIGDGAEAHAAIVESADRLRVQIPWARPEHTVYQEEVEARKLQEKFVKREELWFYMFLKGTPTLVGMSALHGIDWTVPKFEIGYWVRTGYEGQGYVKETVACLTQLALDLGAHRIEIRCDSCNERSWRVAERAGFSLDGILHNDVRDVDGVLTDTRIYSLCRPDDD